MNRRNFFKMVTGFVAGIFVGSAKAKPQLTVAMLQKVKKELTDKEISRMCNTIEPEVTLTIPIWKSLGCKDCYRECRHFEDCLAILRKKVRLNKV